MKEFDEATHPIFIIQDEKIVYTNIATNILLGYRRDELVGKDYREVLKRELLHGESYTDIGSFKKKNGYSIYAYNVDFYKKDDKEYKIVELKGIDIGVKILSSIIEKKYVWKEEEIIELIAKESLLNSNLDRLRLYVAKDIDLENISLVYEYSKYENKGIWKSDFLLNNLLIPYDCSEYPEFWVPLKNKKINYPKGLKKNIEEKTEFLISKVFCVNHRTLYILVAEGLNSKGNKRDLSSLEINLFFYIYKLINDILLEKLNNIYAKKLSNFREELLTIDTRKTLIELVSESIPLPYDKIIMGMSLENENEVGIFIKENGEVKKITTLISDEFTLSNIFINKKLLSINNINYLILNGEKFKELKKFMVTFLKRIGIKEIEENSLLIIYSIEKENQINFIWLINKKGGLYSLLDFELIDPIAKYTLLLLQKFRITEGSRIDRIHAENALKIQKFFLERISHEFRTPITGVLGFTDLLYDLIDTKEGMEYLNAVKESTLRLLNLVDKLLLLARLEAGNIHSGEIAFSLSELENLLREKIKRKIKSGISYIIHMPNIPYSIIGDLEKLRIIFDELIENAIKFTNYGVIEIHAKIIEENIENIKIRFIVKDTGIGISKDKIKYIFSNFAQEEEDIARSYEGMGLGLSIVDKIIKNMNGKIWVESNKEKGSTFYFELIFKKELKDEIFKGKKVYISIENELLFYLLKVYIVSMGAIPISKKEEEYDIKVTEKDISLPITKKGFKYLLWEKINKKNNEKDMENDNKKKIILVAEDNLLNYKYIKMILESSDLITENAKDGKEVLNMLKKKPYNLIIMDIQMPIMDGIEATKKIREKDKKIPIIALTAAAVEEVKEEAKKAGVNEYIIKPFTKEKLIEIISKYIN